MSRVADGGREHHPSKARAGAFVEQPRQRSESPAHRHERQRVGEVTMILDGQQWVGAAPDEDVEVGGHASEPPHSGESPGGDRRSSLQKGEGRCGAQRTLSDRVHVSAPSCWFQSRGGGGWLFICERSSALASALMQSSAWSGAGSTASTGATPVSDCHSCTSAGPPNTATGIVTFPGDNTRVNRSSAVLE